MKSPTALAFYILMLAPAIGHSQASGYFDVRSFGAAGDGQTLETAAIQKAIDACAETGGTVLFPPGKYLTAPSTLRAT